MNREDFLLLTTNTIYFDSAATSLKPSQLSEKISEYYNYYSANAHRGDYDISIKVDTIYEETRKLVADFINATPKEIAFTANATDSMNKIIFGYFKNYLKKGDEILLTKSEHASNILPWFKLVKNLDLKIKYIDLDDKHSLTMENLIKSITPNTKVISIAHITNVVGDVRPIKEITEYAHKNNILVVVDGAQSVPHIKTDVKDLDIDFLAFSAHKMCGPTGVGVLYGKKELLHNIEPIIVGGGMNANFEFDQTVTYNKPPELLEAGTPNIAGIIGFNETIKYLNKIGIDNIHNYCLDLKKYAISKMKNIPGINIYNLESESGIITFNIKDIFSQDLAIYLNKYNICVRAGNHCAKILKDELAVKNTCRISLYFYNTKEEIDELIYVLSNPNIKNEIL